jgi:hypothetical protein
VIGNCYVFDLDGTLADLRHRLHLRGKDHENFLRACVFDAPYEHVLRVARVLSKDAPIVCTSGRNERVRGQSLAWLEWQRLDVTALYMRRDDDRRPDWMVKREMIYAMLFDGWQPIMSFDDRDSVVNMWRENHIPCAQVRRGDF